MKRVLVTGATGFIGRHCLPALVRRAFEVHAVSRRPPPVQDSPEISWHAVDCLANRQECQELLAAIQPTHLLHLAWITDPVKYWTAPENLRWLAASLELLEAYARQGSGRVVVAGSCAELDWSNPVPDNRARAPAPATLYGRCKLALQQVLQGFAAQANLSWGWARYFFMYGPHEHPARLVPHVARALLDRKSVACSHGRQVRDFLHVSDVAEATVALLDSSAQGVVDVASGIGVAVGDIIRQLAAQLNGEDLVCWGAAKVSPNEPTQLVGDPSRLAQEVHWKAAYDLSGGLDQTIDWWRQRAKNAVRAV